MFLRGVTKVLRNEGRYVFYIHPWEFDSSATQGYRVCRCLAGYVTTSICTIHFDA